MKNESNRMRGFTLVELSIVMIIIGLLIGGVLKGAQLVENSRLAAVISTQKQIVAAYNTFLDSYHAKPGDFPYARTMIADCNDATSCFNGNGNNAVGVVRGAVWSNVDSAINNENTQFWKHLALTDLIGGINSSASVVDWGQTHIKSPIAGGFHVSSVTGTGNYTFMQGMIILTRSTSNGQWSCGVATGNFSECSLSPSQAFRIDDKIDDGNAQSGRVAAISMGHQTGCGTPSVGQNGPNGYGSSSVKSCDMFFWIAP